MLETIKTQIKKGIWNSKKGNCFFYVDSINRDTLNMDFESIGIERFFRNNKETIKAKQENNLLNSLMSGNKINLGGF